MVIEHVLNYPNPFTTHTEFFFEHNQPCQALEVTIQVFTVSGKLVKTIQTLVSQGGYRSEGIAWDGRDDFGDRIGKGVYVYRIAVKNPAGKQVEKFEKLVLLR
jgi:flagellar hook assembly protein FlgD